MNTEYETPEDGRAELNYLIANGLAFTIDRKIRKRQKGFSGLFKSRITENETLTFKIEEPTLAILDKLVREQMDLKIDDKALSSEHALSEVRQLTRAQVSRCAKIVALSVLGNDYIVATQGIAGVRYSHNEKKLKELTRLFFHSIKPSKLQYLVLMIEALSNMGAFCNSVRMMSASQAPVADPTEK